MKVLPMKYLSRKKDFKNLTQYGLGGVIILNMNGPLWKTGHFSPIKVLLPRGKNISLERFCQNFSGYFFEQIFNAMAKDDNFKNNKNSEKKQRFP